MFQGSSLVIYVMPKFEETESISNSQTKFLSVFMVISLISFSLKLKCRL